MAYTSTSVAPRALPFTALPEITGRSLWRMIRDALAEARQAQTEREIENYLASTGGKFTDEAEREIERRCGWNPSRW
jgi:hypothetical protein